MDEADLQGARGKLIANPVVQWPRPLKAAYPSRSALLGKGAPIKPNVVITYAPNMDS